MLSTITVSGEENIAKMNAIFSVVREMEKIANDDGSEVSEDGRQVD